MSIFDPYLKEIEHYVKELLAKGRQVTQIKCPTTVSRLKENLAVGIGARRGKIVLREDTFVELGNPEVGSCAFLMWTDKPSMVCDGTITVIGSDIPESPGASLPFGQVIIVGGKDLGEKDHDALAQSQYVSDRIEGYMLKSTSQHTWGRVSKDAASKGFCFETLGRSLMAIFKSELSNIEAMEMIFVTSSKEDLKPLSRIADQVQQIGRNITKQTWKTRGYDVVECSNGVSCSSCSSRDVCDDIREVISIRKKQTNQDATRAV